MYAAGGRVPVFFHENHRIDDEFCREICVGSREGARTEVPEHMADITDNGMSPLCAPVAEDRQAFAAPPHHFFCEIRRHQSLSLIAEICPDDDFYVFISVTNPFLLLPRDPFADFPEEVFSGLRSGLSGRFFPDNADDLICDCL